VNAGVVILPSGLIEITTFRQHIKNLEHRAGVSRPEHPLRRFIRRSGLVRLQKARQHIGLRPEDAFIDSFPRSGNTWTRFVLTQLLLSKEVGFSEVHATIPRVGSHQDAPGLLPGGGRLLKTHEQYRPAYGRTVLLLRDPRDMALSYRRFLAAYGHEYPDTSGFIRDLASGSIGTNGTWLEHTNSWLAARENGAAVHVVTYEQIRRSPVDHFFEIAEFLGIPATREEVGEAASMNTTDNMREKESEVDRPHHVTSDRSFSFVGKGEVGGWRGQLTDAQLEPLMPSVELYESVAGDLKVG